MVKKVTIYTSLQNGGDGSAHNKWFLTEDEAYADQETHNEDDGWGEECVEAIETFVGSNIYNEAKA